MGKQTMKTGISSYCLSPAMAQGASIYDVIDYAVALGCEHIEFVPFYTPFVLEQEGRLNESYIDSVREKCQNAGLEISTYSVNADLINADPAIRQKEIARVKLHVDAAHRLGLKYMRHDLASFRRPFEENTPENFERDFPLMVEGVREIYRYADERGIATTLENHGFFCNGADRLIRILRAADCPNLKMTMDVGNFMCVDEDPVAAVRKCLPYAAIIHFKDFYIREKNRLPGQTEMFNCNNGSWFETMAGRMLRGSILGQGDIDIPGIVHEIVRSGFNGYLSLEFEGMEECKQGTEISFAMTKALFSRELKA